MDERQFEADRIDRRNVEIELHNNSQERVVQRAQDMVKMLFVVSGGALAVCANFFSTGKSLGLESIFPIRVAWVSLTASMLLFGIALLLLLARDYFFGEIQGEILESGEANEKDVSPYWTKFTWLSGLLGFTCFSLGMCSFAWSAWLYLEVVN